MLNKCYNIVYISRFKDHTIGTELSCFDNFNEKYWNADVAIVDVSSVDVNSEMSRLNSIEMLKKYIKKASNRNGDILIIT